MDLAAPADLTVFWQLARRGQDADLDDHFAQRTFGYIQQRLYLDHSLYILLQFLNKKLFENVTVQESLTKYF